MKKNNIVEIIFFFLLVIYVFKINEIAINYTIHIEEERKEEERKEKEYQKLKDDLIKEYNDKKKEIIYNKCVIEKVPKVTGMLETSHYLLYSNSSFIRFGDSEINTMRRMDDFKQDYNETLRIRLSEAFFNNNPNVMIGVPNVFDGFPKFKRGITRYWMNYKGINWLREYMNYSKQYFDTFITSPYISTYDTSCELVNLIYNNIKEIFRDKDIVILRGNNSEVYDYDVYEYAKTQKIFFAPPKNAWEKYDELRETLLEEDENALYIICIGMSSEVLVMDLVKEGRRAMDMGHLAKDYDCYMKQKYDNDFFK